MATARSTPLTKQVPNQPIPNQLVPNNEVPADCDRREGRITEGAIGAKTYPAPYEYDDFDRLSNVALFLHAQWFDTVALDQNGFGDWYATTGLLSGDVPLRAFQTFAWRSSFSSADGDLIIGHGWTLQQQS